MVLSDSGFFFYLALILAKKLSCDVKRILILFPPLAGFSALFLNSITVLLFLAVLTFETAKLLNINPVPIIIAGVVIANTGAQQRQLVVHQRHFKNATRIRVQRV